MLVYICLVFISLIVNFVLQFSNSEQFTSYCECKLEWCIGFGENSHAIRCIDHRKYSTNYCKTKDPLVLHSSYIELQIQQSVLAKIVVNL